MNTVVTRIDLEKCGQSSVFVRKWNEGWNLENAGAPDSEDLVEGRTIASILGDLEKQGFTVDMVTAEKGRALRGRITRIDIILDDETWKVSKFPYGWTARTRPIETKEFSTKEEADAAINWLRENKWTIFEFPGGARAFRGKPYPVRDRSAILSLRRKLQAERKHRNWDLAFCF